MLSKKVFVSVSPEEFEFLRMARYELNLTYRDLLILGADAAFNIPQS